MNRALQSRETQMYGLAGMLTPIPRVQELLRELDAETREAGVANHPFDPTARKVQAFRERVHMTMPPQELQPGPGCDRISGTSIYDALSTATDPEILNRHLEIIAARFRVQTSQQQRQQLEYLHDAVLSLHKNNANPDEVRKITAFEHLWTAAITPDRHSYAVLFQSMLAAEERRFGQFGHRLADSNVIEQVLNDYELKIMNESTVQAAHCRLRCLKEELDFHPPSSNDPNIVRARAEYNRILNILPLDDRIAMPPPPGADVLSTDALCDLLLSGQAEKGMLELAGRLRSQHLSQRKDQLNNFHEMVDRMQAPPNVYWNNIFYGFHTIWQNDLVSRKSQPD